MSVKDEIRWFKENFASDILPALEGTPIPFDLVCAIAYQETGELWGRMRRTLPRDEVLRLSCGDTLDAPNRSAFPRTRRQLEAAAGGREMFLLAHELLVEMGQATGIETYQRVARNPDKFVHGYGIFQYDLQFFQEDPSFFLEQKWTSISACLEKLMGELRGALQQLGCDDKPTLTDAESAFVAIVYNTGFPNFKASRGLLQGYFDGVHYYGENIDAYLKIARTIPTPVRWAPRPLALFRAGASGHPSIVSVARAELVRYGGINEGDEPLRSRIADYYEAGGGSRELDPTLPQNAWSAAFVSFCVRGSGATPEQFAFSLQHSVFVYRAIQNTLAGSGVFRGHHVAEYAPKLGDIIHHNRSGTDLSFDYARTHAGYPSHSAIVVDFVTQNGIRHAVTIGGNETLARGTGTVGRKLLPLDANGLLDQGAISWTRLISVIENLLEPDGAEALRGPYVVRVRSDLKLRGGPGVSFPALKSLMDGTQLLVLSFEENASGRWALVDLEGDGVKDGYVFAAFIEPAIG